MIRSFEMSYPSERKEIRKECDTLPDEKGPVLGPGFVVFTYGLSNPSESLEEGKKVIVWSKDYKGDIYSFYFSLEGQMDYGKVGYADGKGNYYIGVIGIASNETLIIEPGITIHFFTDCYNYIYGSIKAIGTKDQNIIFTSNGTNEVAAWNGFRVYNDYPGITVFKYCQFKYSRFAYIERDAEFDHCIFNTTYGIDISSRYEHPVNVDQIIIKNCVFTGDSSGPKVPELRGLNIVVDKILRVENSIFEDITHMINVGAGEILSFKNNVVKSNEMVWFGCNGQGNVSNNEIGNYYVILSNVDAYNNVISSEEIRIRSINGEPKSFRNNRFFGNMTYTLMKNQTKRIDLRYNSFGVDWPVEKVIGLEEIENPGSIIYEPYYDLNWTLTDNDGMRNGWEAKYGLDIHANDSYLDSDQDGLTNYEEFEYSMDHEPFEMDPSNSDTDSDGMPDRWEIDHQLLPFINDTFLDNDRDNYTNIEEYRSQTDPNDPLSHPKEKRDLTKIIPMILYVVSFVVLIAIIILTFIFLWKRRPKRVEVEVIK
jgi:hypothetical protein